MDAQGPFPKHISEPLDVKVGEANPEPWDALLAHEPDKDFLKKERDTEEESWRNRTFPLLARPELFLPPHVQDAFTDAHQQIKKSD